MEEVFPTFISSRDPRSAAVLYPPLPATPKKDKEGVGRKGRMIKNRSAMAFLTEKDRVLVRRQLLKTQPLLSSDKDPLVFH